MPLPLAGLAVAAGVMVIGSAVSWLCGELSEEEKEKQSKLLKEKDNLDIQIRELESEDNFLQEQELRILDLQVEEISETFIKQIEDYRLNKLSIYDSIEEMNKFVKAELSRKDISFHHRRALSNEKRRLEDARYRLDSYFDYLDWYEKKIKYLNSRKLIKELRNLDIPRALLPEDYFHVGMIICITHEEVNQYLNRENKYRLKLTLDDYEALKDEFPEEIPLLITKRHKDNKSNYYGSITKGILHLDYLYNDPPTPFEIECLEYKGWGNYVCFKDLGKIIDNKYINQIKLPKSNKISPLKKYSPGDKFDVYPVSWDLLLKNIEVSEKVPENNNSNLIIPIVYDSSNIDEEILIELDEKLFINDKFTFIPVEDSNSNIVILKNDNIFLKCRILSDRLIINDIFKKEIDDLKICAEVFFSIEIIEEKLFQKDFYINLEEAIYEFSTILFKEFDYQKFLLKENSIDEKKESFFQKWTKVIEYSINEERYEIIFDDYFEEFSIEQVEVSGKDNYLLIVNLEKDKYESLKLKLKKISDINRKNKKKNNFRVNISGRLKEDNKPFSSYEIGNIEDIRDEDCCLIIQLDGNPEDFMISPEFSIKVKSINFPYPLIQQKKALINFHKDIIKNKELKKTLIAPSIIKSEIDPIFKKYFDKDIDWQNKHLTENQKIIIKSALIEKNIFLIQGPPGTGKTTTIKELVYQFLKEKTNARILIVSQQNVAVDNALSRIYKDEQNQQRWFSENASDRKSIIRCGNSEKIKDNVIQKLSLEHWFNEYRQNTIINNNNSEDLKFFRDEWNQYIDKDDIKEVDNQILEILLKSHQIVGATCVGLAQKSIGLDLLEFDLVIIDEAGRATPPELLIPILKGNKVILIGDHHQLPPSISKSLVDDSDGNILSKLGIEKEFLEVSLFEYIFDKSPDTNKAKLIDQFRMPENIGSLISTMFYNSELKNGLFNGEVKKVNEHFFFNQEIQWVNVKGKQEKDGTSSFNLSEVDKIMDLLMEIDQLSQEKDRKIDIAIITPYSAQKKRLRQKKDLLFKNRIFKYLNDDNIRIDTVDSFQGSEAEIVIYSTVRTYGNINFLIDKRRLNVAISRTKENLIFVGNKKFMSQDISSESDINTNYFKLIASALDNYKYKEFSNSH